MQLIYVGELNKHVIHSEGQKNLTGTTGINKWPNHEVNWKWFSLSYACIFENLKQVTISGILFARETVKLFTFFLHYVRCYHKGWLKPHREGGATQNCKQSWKAVDLAKVQVSLGTMCDEKMWGVTRVQL